MDNYTKQEKIWYSIMLNCEYEWYPDQDMQMCRKTLNPCWYKSCPKLQERLTENKKSSR